MTAVVDARTPSASPTAEQLALSRLNRNGRPRGTRRWEAMGYGHARKERLKWALEELNPRELGANHRRSEAPAADTVGAFARVASTREPADCQVLAQPPSDPQAC